MNNIYMPSHYKMKPKSKAKKTMKVFSKMPPNSHRMGNVIMSGKKHTASSRVIGKLKPKKK